MGDDARERRISEALQMKRDRDEKEEVADTRRVLVRGSPWVNEEKDIAITSMMIGRDFYGTLGEWVMAGVYVIFKNRFPTITEDISDSKFRQSLEFKYIDD